MRRGLAASCYLPVPGWAFAAPRLAPRDRLVRLHAWQGGLTVAAAWVLLPAAGWMHGAPALEPAARVAAGVLVVAFAAALLWGCAAALRGRLPRLRPAWDLARALRPR